MPSLQGSTLSVGTAKYTSEYHKAINSPEKYTTIDVDVKRAEYGSPSRHIVADLVEYDFGSEQFDNVLLFGLFGLHNSNTNDLSMIAAVHKKAYYLIKKGGMLLCGYGTVARPSDDWRKLFMQYPFILFNRLTIKLMGPNFIWQGWKKK